MMPRIFHHVWPGSDVMPAQTERLMETWRYHHPSWELRLWRPDDLRWLANRALFDRAPSYAQKADIARYEVVRAFGGVYLDTDMECLQPIDELLTDDLTFFAGHEASGSINISMFGAT